MLGIAYELSLMLIRTYLVVLFFAVLNSQAQAIVVMLFALNVNDYGFKYRDSFGSVQFFGRMSVGVSVCARLFVLNGICINGIQLNFLVFVRNVVLRQEHEKNRNNVAI